MPLHCNRRGERNFGLCPRSWCDPLFAALAVPAFHARVHGTAHGRHVIANAITDTEKGKDARGSSVLANPAKRHSN